MGAYLIRHAFNRLFGSPSTFRLDYGNYPVTRVSLSDARHCYLPSCLKFTLNRLSFDTMGFRVSCVL